VRQLVLLGDSILDNAPYTRPEPDTADHLRRLLGAPWQVELLARDGALMADVRHQLQRIAQRPEVAVLSIGGNDFVRHVGLLDRPATASADVFAELLQIADAFEERYHAAATAVAKRSARTLLCTIYEAQLEPPRYAELVRVPLAVLNDRIGRVGARLGLDVLDLRNVCTDAADFVLQIEPSPAGAAKIARAIADAVQATSESRRSCVFPTGTGTV
jgi:lysophospholipase L1-like esterase